MKFILETKRLTLREFTLGDAKFIVDLVNTPGWIEFIGDRNIKTEEQARTYLETGPIKSYGLNGFGHAVFGVITKHFSKPRTPI